MVVSSSDWTLHGHGRGAPSGHGPARWPTVASDTRARSTSEPGRVPGGRSGASREVVGTAAPSSAWPATHWIGDRSPGRRSDRSWRIRPVPRGGAGRCRSASEDRVGSPRAPPRRAVRLGGTPGRDLDLGQACSGGGSISSASGPPSPCPPSFPGGARSPRASARSAGRRGSGRGRRRGRPSAGTPSRRPPGDPTSWKW